MGNSLIISESEMFLLNKSACNVIAGDGESRASFIQGFKKKRMKEIFKTIKHCILKYGPFFLTKKYLPSSIRVS